MQVEKEKKNLLNNLGEQKRLLEDAKGELTEKTEVRI